MFIILTTMILGFLYHDIAGGNDLMKIKANWSNTYNTEEITYKLMTDAEKEAIKEQNRIFRAQRYKEAKEQWKTNPWNMGPIKN